VARATKEWRAKGRVAAILGASVMKHLQIARKVIRERKEQRGALLMQTYFRGKMERKQCLEQKAAIKNASKVVLDAFNGMKAREGMTQWLNDAVAERRQINTQNQSDAVNARQPIPEPTVPEPAVDRKPEPEPEPEPERVAEPEIAGDADSDSRPNMEASIDPTPAAKSAALQPTVDTASINNDSSKSEENKEMMVEDMTADPRSSIASTTSNISSKEERDRVVAANKKQKLKEDEIVKRSNKKPKRGRYRQMPSMFNISVDPDDILDVDPTEPEPIDPGVNINDLRSFKKIAAMGQLFYRHAGRKTAQDRVVKVCYDHEGTPLELSWGKGSRHIMWDDILYVAWGHWTPVFLKKQNKLNPQRCLSVVARNGRVLDLEGYNKSITELWVRGLRTMMGHSDEYCEEQSRKNVKNFPVRKPTGEGCSCKKVNCKCKCKEKGTACKCKMKEVIKLQQDLYIMSTHTVLRELEEERIWIVDEDVRATFAPQKMWPTVLKADVPWRTWQHWLREQVTSYCRENGKFVQYNNPQPQFVPYPQPPVHDDNDPDGACRLQ